MDYFLSADFLVGFTMMLIVLGLGLAYAINKAGKAGVVVYLILICFFTVAYGAKHVIG